MVWFLQLYSHSMALCRSFKLMHNRGSNPIVPNAELFESRDARQGPSQSTRAQVSDQVVVEIEQLEVNEQARFKQLHQTLNVLIVPLQTVIHELGSLAETICEMLSIEHADLWTVSVTVGERFGH